jgi:hypothetical protein
MYALCKCILKTYMYPSGAVPLVLAEYFVHLAVLVGRVDAVVACVDNLWRERQHPLSGTCSVIVQLLYGSL